MGAEIRKEIEEKGEQKKRIGCDEEGEKHKFNAFVGL